MNFVSENHTEIRNRQISNETIHKKSLSAINGANEYLSSDQFISMPQNPRDMDGGNGRVNRNILNHRTVPRESLEVTNYTKRGTQEQQVLNPETNIHDNKDSSRSDFSAQETVQATKVNQDKSKSADESKGEQKNLLGARVTKYYEKYGRFNGIVKQYNHPFYLIEYERGDCERVTHQQLLELLEKPNENINQRYKPGETQPGKDPDTYHDNLVHQSSVDFPVEANYYHPHYRNQGHHHLQQQQQHQMGYHDDRDHRDYQNPSGYHPLHPQIQQPRHEFEQGIDPNKTFKHDPEHTYKNEIDPAKGKQFDHESGHHHDPQDYSQQQYYSYYQYHQYPYQYSYQHPYHYVQQDQYGVPVNNSENPEIAHNVYDAGDIHQYSQQVGGTKGSEEGSEYDNTGKKLRKSSTKKRKVESSVIETPNSKRPRGRPRKIAIENPLVDCPLKKPLSAMKLFIVHKVQELKSTQPKEKKQNLTPIARRLWGELSIDEKSLWESKSKGLLEEYSNRLDFFLERRPDIREQLEIERELKKKVRADYRRVAREKKRGEKNSSQHQSQQENDDSPTYSQSSHQIPIHDSYGNMTPNDIQPNYGHSHPSNYVSQRNSLPNSSRGGGQSHSGSNENYRQIGDQQNSNIISNNESNQIYNHEQQSNTPQPFNESYINQQKPINSDGNKGTKKQDINQQQLSQSQYQASHPMYQHYLSHSDTTSLPSNQQQQQQQYHQIHPSYQRQHYQQFLQQQQQDPKYRNHQIIQNKSSQERQSANEFGDEDDEDDDDDEA